MFAIVKVTIHEAIAKKIILGFFALSTLIIFIFLVLVNIESIDSVVEVSKQTDIKAAVIGFESIIMGVSYLFIITISLIAVSSIIPSMVEKGNIDLLLSKPIGRTKIIIGKFVGGVILIFLNLVYLIGCVWLILSLKSGFWHFPFLYSIIWLTVSFAVIYSLVILLGLTTQSTIISSIVTLFLVLIVLPILGARADIADVLKNDFVKFVLDFFYYILPKPGGINMISAAQITEQPIESWLPLWTSLLFMVTMLALSIYYFKKKDY